MKSYSIDALKQALLDEYGHFADKRIKRLESGSAFIVDDRSAGDHDARGKLFLWFCSIWLDVESGEAVGVVLSGGVPRSPVVDRWRAANETPGKYDRPTIKINRGEQGKLLELVDAIAAIIAKGAPRYPVAAYKYVCPRTAASLTRLKSALDKAWGE